MENKKEPQGLGSMPIIEPFLERNGKTFGARVTRILPGEPCQSPKIEVGKYSNFSNLALLLSQIGLDEEERLEREGRLPTLELGGIDIDQAIH